MIQRKQTLFLLFAVIAIAICLFLPIASIAAKTMGGDTMVYNLGVVGRQECRFQLLAFLCSFCSPFQPS